MVRIQTTSNISEHLKGHCAIFTSVFVKVKKGLIRIHFCGKYSFPYFSNLTQIINLSSTHLSFCCFSLDSFYTFSIMEITQLF